MRKAWCMPAFLKLVLSAKSVCVCVYVCVCMCATQAIENHSCERKPEFPIKQVVATSFQLLYIAFDINTWPL